MSRKLIITLALSLVLVLVFSIGVFAQGPNPANSQNGTAVGNSAQQMQRIQDPTLNSTGDLGTCVNFVDADEDGVCDNALLGGVGSQVGTMSRQNSQLPPAARDWAPTTWMPTATAPVTTLSTPMATASATSPPRTARAASSARACRARAAIARHAPGSIQDN